MSKSKSKNEKTNIQEELKQEADLITKSVDFWAAEVDRVFEAIDQFDELPEFQQDYKALEGLLQNLERLVQRGDQEQEILDRFENKFYKLWPKVLRFKAKKEETKSHLENSFVIKLPNNKNNPS